MQTRRVNNPAVRDAQNVPHGDFPRAAREQIASIDTAPADQYGAALQLEENLLQVLERNPIALGDLVDGDNVGYAIAR